MDSWDLIEQAVFTTMTYSAEYTMLDEIPVWVLPTSLYCYTVGRNAAAAATSSRMPTLGTRRAVQAEDEDDEAA